ncbi:hypothetical protein [Thalassobacillus hwangdonensis]|uniref:Uncharacterized protein n=1 Tax=Thalassobacillus hwangdonensis TaxID=546108 RepID=A0ABW3L7D4_9BACI
MVIQQYSEVIVVLGLLMSEMEKDEIEYLLRRELEELLLDLGDHRIDHMVKRAMQERYGVLFQLFKKVASHKDCIKYMPRKRIQR